ncbi:MAG: hypothetical protein JNK63_07900 [Chthonomonas sp.]|nr:hypothetical protein [Chthonomonas sp.]
MSGKPDTDALCIVSIGPPMRRGTQWQIRVENGLLRAEQLYVTGDRKIAWKLDELHEALIVESLKARRRAVLKSVDYAEKAGKSQVVAEQQFSADQLTKALEAIGAWVEEKVSA